MILLTSDWHLTDNIKEEYRWRFVEHTLPKLVDKYRVSEVLCLGDVTDHKDRHSARLVNRIVESLRGITSLCPVKILSGNHDSIDPATPFLRWLQYHKRITFIWTPTDTELDGHRVLFLPHTFAKDGYDGAFDFNNYDYIFCHQTFAGAKGENGQKLSGLSTQVFAGIKARVYAGDVHVPQKVGRVEYIGAPYHVHFGDVFEPRVLLDDGRGAYQEIVLKTPRRRILEVQHPDALEDFKLRTGDQIKVEVKLFRSEFGKWDEYRQQVRSFALRAGVELCGIKLVENVRRRLKPDSEGQREYLADPKKVFDSYCARNKDRISPKMRLAGEELL